MSGPGFAPRSLGRIPTPCGLGELPDGILPAALVGRHPLTGCLLPSEPLRTAANDAVQPVVSIAYRRLLHCIDWALDRVPDVRLRLAHGTIGGRKVTDPCEWGEWHRDTGDAPARVVVTWALEWPDLECGHHMRGHHAPYRSGEVALFSDAEHRRPLIPFATPRVLLSVALYPASQAADLTCPTLRPLADRIGGAQ